MKKIKMILGNSFKNDIRVLKEARTLVQNGYEVEVLAWDRENEFLDREYDEIDGIKIKRFFPKAKYGSGKKQIFSFIKFIFEVRDYLKNKDFNYLHCHDLDGLIVGFFCKTKNNKLVYDSHEFFTGYKGIYINKKIYFLEKILMKKVDKIISVSESICKKLQEIYNLEELPTLIRNIPYYYENSKKKNLLRKEFNISGDKIILLYQGGFSKGRGIEKIIESLKYLPEKYILVLIGKGNLKDEILKLIQENNLQGRVYIKNFVSNEKLLQYTNSADIGIYFMQKTSLNHWYALPNKLFEFIQGELPIICSNFPDMKNIVKKYRIGESVDYNNQEELINKIQTIFLRNNSINYLENLKITKKDLCWENEEKKLLELYKKIEFEGKKYESSNNSWS